ncbi:splicing factor SF3a60, partial [Tanacetum coccineum]
VAADFEEQWAEGKIDGWKDESQENGHVNASIDLDFYDTVKELVGIGGDRLKEALGALGLKTGGTVQQRAERLFLTKVFASFTQAIDLMFFMHEGLQQARAPIHDVPLAIEILLTGIYDGTVMLFVQGEFKVLLPLITGDTLQCGEYCIWRYLLEKQVI